MKKALIFLLIVLSVIFIRLAYFQGIKSENCFFLSSLHYTAKGMAHWYNKANGGLETITGIAYSKLSCQNCHVSSCDVCHKTEKQGKPSYSSKVARNQEMCLECHAREASIIKIDQLLNQQDVHFSEGMQCMDCHSAREIHGDGSEYISMKQQGAMDTKCENCHESITGSISHTVHEGKLDCKSCHERHVVSCSNCHFDTLLKEGKRVAIPLSGWVFLMNYNGKVTAANMQTFVVESDKTFLMFAPQHSHSIMKNGRKCEDCHATEIVKRVKKGKLSVTWHEKGELKQLKGVIPVKDGTKYIFIYYDYKNGKWIPITNPPDPLLHYVGYGKPLSEEQVDKLSQSVDKD